MSSASSPASAAAPLNRPMITISIMLATLIQTLDSTIANVALPHMQGTLSASQDEITWVLTSYIVAAAIATPLTGWLSDRLSVKRLLIVAIGGFTVSSALCGLSETLTQIVASRLLQGIFGASLVPLSQSILLDINPREKQGQAMAVWGMGVMVGPILGPTLGGWLTDSYNWRWVFFINVPIGAFALFGVATFLPSREPKHDVEVRRVRLHHAGSRDRRIAGDARSRRATRLVLLDRDRHRGARRGDQLRVLPRAHGNGRRDARSSNTSC